MPLFRTKPVVKEAVRWLNDSASLQAIKSLGEGVKEHSNERDLLIETLEGEMRCEMGDWVIKGLRGELYPCKDDIFQATYEPVEEVRRVANNDNKDEAEEAIEAIRDWAADKDWFDLGFVDSMSEALEKYGSLTDSQMTALENIMERFRC